MFSSIFKLASVSVRSNVVTGGCRWYTKTNPVFRRIKARSNRPWQQNIEEVNYDYEKEPVSFNEGRETESQFGSKRVSPGYGRQYQQCNEENKEKNQQSDMNIMNRRQGRQYQQNVSNNEGQNLQFDPRQGGRYQNNVIDMDRDGYVKDEGLVNPRHRRQYQHNIADMGTDGYAKDEGHIKDEQEVVELSPDEVKPIREELNMIPREQEIVSRKNKRKKDKASDHDRTGIVEIGENMFKYKVLGHNSKDLVKEVLECKTSKDREKNQKLMLEGKRLIYDAITSNVKPLKIFFTRTEDLKKFKLPLNIELYKICYEDLQVWSNVKTSQGIIGIFKTPSVESLKPSPDTLPLTIICDQVREPGNMGSIIRVAAGVGCRKLILTKGCVDIWDSKVLRSAAGAHFRLPIIKAQSWDEIYNNLPDDFGLYLADSEMPPELDAESPEEVKLAGLAFKKKFMVSDNVPLGIYHSQKFWEKKSVVLVVGGETIGLSVEAYQLAIEKYGKRIYIPLSNGVESLNSGVALSVLSYEIRRQYSCEKNEEKREQLSNNESYQAVGLYSE